MRLSAVPLVNYSNTNSFMGANEWIIRAGDPNKLYFQLIDLDSCGGKLRYMTGVDVSNQPVVVTVTFPSIDDEQVITVDGTVDPNDASVFSIDLTNLQIPAGGNVTFSITEGTATRQFTVINMISVEQINQGSC